MLVGCLLFVCSWSARGPCNVTLGVVPAWEDKPAGDVLLYLSSFGWVFLLENCNS